MNLFSTSSLVFLRVIDDEARDMNHDDGDGGGKGVKTMMMKARQGGGDFSMCAARVIGP